VESRIYSRNVGMKVKYIFLSLLLSFFEGSDATIIVLVVSVGHWGVNGASGSAQKRGYR